MQHTYHVIFSEILSNRSLSSKTQLYKLFAFLISVKVSDYDGTGGGGGGDGIVGGASVV